MKVEINVRSIISIPSVLLYRVTLWQNLIIVHDLRITGNSKTKHKENSGSYVFSFHLSIMGTPKTQHTQKTQFPYFLSFHKCICHWVFMKL